MYKKMVVYVVKNRNIDYFQVGYMSYPGLNQNKAFKDQVENMSMKFDKLTMVNIV